MNTSAVIPLLFLSISLPASADPLLATREQLLNNDKVEVVRATYAPGAESGMHTHAYPTRVAYFVKGGTLALTSEDETQPPKILTVDDGKVLYLPGATHNVKNVGASEVILVETELK